MGHWNLPSCGDFLREHSPDITALSLAGDMTVITNNLREFQQMPERGLGSEVEASPAAGMTNEH